MKTKTNIFLSIATISIALIIISIKLITQVEPRHTFESDKRHTDGGVPEYQTTQKNDIVSNPLNSIAESIPNHKTAQKNETGSSPQNSIAETIKRESSSKKNADYQILGHENMPLDLDRKTLMDRIDNGITSMEIVELKVYPDSEVLIMEKAYERLIGSLSFIDGKFPIWGVDRDSYFVFSGRSGTSPDLAFKYGYAIKKENGRIYRWFAPQE